MRLFRILALLVGISFGISPSYAALRVGTVLFYPPFVMSQATGFDIQLMQIICQNLKEQCTLIPMNYNKLFSALDSGEIDIAIGGVTIDSATQAKYIYSIPYMLSKGVFLVAKDNNDIQSVKDLHNTKVGVLRGKQDGGVFYNFLLVNFPNDFQIIQYDSVGDIIAAINKGDINAAFMHESTALYWESNSGGQFKIVSQPALVGNGIGIVSIPNNMELIQRINQQITQLTKEDIYLDLYTTYFANEK